MNHIQKLITAATLAGLTALSAGLGLARSEEKETLPQAGMITKEQAIDKALAEHPGKVEKAYMETKRGRKVWEVQVRGQDGKEWELYYDAETGELAKAEHD